MIIRPFFAFSVFAFTWPLFGADEKALTPVEARKKVGAKIVVRMEVKSGKDRLEKRGEIYLDSDTDFKSDQNFAVVITKKGAASLKAAGIDAPPPTSWERPSEPPGPSRRSTECRASKSTTQNRSRRSPR